jgi:hypothetical protein
MYESHPERMVVNEMRRDSPNVFQNEQLAIVFDTFYDRRNAVGFSINPIGGRQDGQITNERWNRDWNTIFDFGVGKFDGGWTAELAIPFKSLRYRPGASQIWGINARRVNKWKNEMSHLAPMPCGQRRLRALPNVAGRNARGPRGAGLARKTSISSRMRRQTSPPTAMRGRASRMTSAPMRRGRQVRRDAEPHRRFHVQHRLRARSKPTSSRST